MEYIRISVAHDFTKTPGGRFKKEGDFSGEEFRDKILNPAYSRAVKEKMIIRVDLDGCMGYPSSFLDESFGGLARMYKNEDVLNHFEFISEDQPGLVEEIQNMMRKGK